MKDIINVFNSEIYKITRKKSLYITIFFISLPSLLNILFTVLYNTFGWLSPAEGFDSFCMVGTFWYPIVAGVFITGIINEDYTSEAIKQIVSSGIVRRKYIIGEWLALVVLLTGITISLGCIYGAINTILYQFGDYNTTTILLKVIAEVLTISVLVSFTQTVMHATKSTGVAIAVIVFVFMMSDLVLIFVSDLLHGLDAYWLTDVLSNATDIDKSIPTRLFNMLGVLVYQVVFVISSIEIFKRKQI